MRLVTNESDLSSNPDTAAWLFESAACDDSRDPLVILMQREQEEEEDEIISFARRYS